VIRHGWNFDYKEWKIVESGPCPSVWRKSKYLSQFNFVFRKFVIVFKMFAFFIHS
jgi:hypothetical protein